MAALEAKNEATEAENTNLRDLLSRLQEENLALKQAQFTFSVPKPASVATPASDSSAQPSPFSFFGTPSPFPASSATTQAASTPSAFGSDIDWTSLTTFDPSMLSVLDEPSDVPMQTDTASSPFGQYALPQSYKTIANNPLLMSFVDESPLASSNTTSTTTNALDHFSFSFSSPANGWPSVTQSPPYTQNHGHSDFLHSNHSLDELFGGNFPSNQGTLDLTALVENPSISPVAHTNGVKASSTSQKPTSSPPSNSNTSSPSSASQSPFSWTTVSQPGESPPSGSDSANGANAVCAPLCHLKRADIASYIVAEGPSPFTDQPNPLVRKTSDVSGDIVACQGSKFPRTMESPDNIEALKAWRCITQNPHFRVRVLDITVRDRLNAFYTGGRY